MDTPDNRTLDRESPLPLWAQLYQDLTSRLRAGEFAGDFPAEGDLAAAYGISRNTVREAMRRLRDDGVVIAGRGRRPRTALSTIEQPLGAIYSLFASVEAAGLDQQSVVRALDVRADDAVAARLGLAATTPLFYLERLRLAAGEPLAIDRVWLPGDVGAPLVDVDFSHTSLYRELRDRSGLTLTTAREQIRAVVPSREDRRLLAIGADNAALAIDRLSNVADRPVEWRRTIIRGDAFTLVADFSARTGFQFDFATADNNADPAPETPSAATAPRQPR